MALNGVVSSPWTLKVPKVQNVLALFAVIGSRALHFSTSTFLLRNKLRLFDDYLRPRGLRGLCGLKTTALLGPPVPPSPAYTPVHGLRIATTSLPFPSMPLHA